MKLSIIPAHSKGASDFSDSREGIFWILNYMAIALVVFLMIASVFTLFIYSFPAFKSFGLKLFFGNEWDPENSIFGGFPFIVGTLITSFIALLICIPFSLSLSLFMGQYYPDGRISKFLRNAVDLLASIPSVIYGFWGLLILAPCIQSIEMKYDILPYGVGIFTASLLLSVMIIPYASSLGSTIIKMVPKEIKEAAIALGATPFETVRYIVIPKAFSGILAGIFLSFARALGETMAVTMVIGNANRIPESIFSPGNTLASLIANEFTEATGNQYVSALIAMAFILLIISSVFNIAGKLIIMKWSDNK